MFWVKQVLVSDLKIIPKVLANIDLTSQIKKYSSLFSDSMIKTICI